MDDPQREQPSPPQSQNEETMAAPVELPVPVAEVTGRDESQASKEAAKESEKDFGRRDGETTKEYIKREYSTLRPFVIMSTSYLLYTVTDGAVRMIVLLHAYTLGFTAWEVALMFTLYELAGVFTNLVAGLIGARWGIKQTLLSGLVLQVAGLGMLFAWQSDWSKLQGGLYVSFAQMLCGIAKDLVKLGGKTVTKLVSKEDKDTRLFRLVSFITGLKNSFKGFGYFLGSGLLAVNYYAAVGVMTGLVIAAMPWAAIGLPNDLGRTRKENIKLKSIFKMNYNVNILSAARIFLFGSRDLWFEVPLPFFLRDVAYGFGWSRFGVGSYLAGWIIIYGQIQSWSPQLALKPLRQDPPNRYVTCLWVGMLAIIPIIYAPVIQFSDAYVDRQLGGMVASMTVLLYAFCIVFAVNSAIHSFLVVKYAEGDKVSSTVGFYYMSNAVGRLTGTLMSGALYSFTGDTVRDGFGNCFWASFAFVIAAFAISVFLHDDQGGLQCGPRLSCVSVVDDASGEKEDIAVGVEGEIGEAGDAGEASDPVDPVKQGEETSTDIIIQESSSASVQTDSVV